MSALDLYDSEANSHVWWVIWFLYLGPDQIKLPSSRLQAARVLFLSPKRKMIVVVVANVSKLNLQFVP